MATDLAARISAVVERAQRGEYAAAADEAEALLQGTANMSAEEAEQILRALNVSHGYFVQGVKERAGTPTVYRYAKQPPGAEEKVQAEVVGMGQFYRRLLAAVAA